MIKDWNHYFDKVENSSTLAFDGDESHALMSNVSFYHKLTDVDLSVYDIAVLGVCDARNSNNKSCSKAPDQIRKSLYGLVNFSRSLNILDLGNLKGNTVNDKYQLLEDVVCDLMDWSIVPVVIGGSQDYTLPLARAVKRHKRFYRIAVVDSKIDWVRPDKDFSSTSFLGLLCSEERSVPEDLSIIGCQKYYVAKNQFEELRGYSFDFLRLGDIKQKGVKLVEPWIRDADLVSFDINAIRQSDLPVRFESAPNGFFADEACQIAWYAGLSDQLKVFGLFELGIGDNGDRLNPMVAAQVLWHLCEGYSLRCGDYPVKKIEDYRQCIVHLDEYEIDMKFYNNPENDRWWVEVPGIDSNVIIACDRKDFELASEREIPDKWFRFLKKKEL